MAFLFRLLWMLAALLLLFSMMIGVNHWNLDRHIFMNGGFVLFAISIIGIFITAELKKRKDATYDYLSRMAFYFRLLFILAILLFLFSVMIRLNHWNFNRLIFMNSALVLIAFALIGTFTLNELKKKKEEKK